MTIGPLYRQVRSVVRELGHRDSLYVVWAYCQFLQADEFDIPADIHVGAQFLNAVPPQSVLAEWTLEQIAREVIRHADEESRKGRTLRSWDTVATIANALRNLESAIYSELVGGARIQLELMRIAHRQFVWQQQRFHWSQIIRYYKLFDTPEIVAHAQQATGLSLREIYLIGMSYLGHFFDRSWVTQTVDIEIPGLTQEHFDSFLALMSLRRDQLAARLRAEHALDEGFSYRYSSLREFPLVRISHRGREQILCPIPTLLYWRMTTGLYYSLKDIPGFSVAFGSSFQRYVGEVLSRRITNPNMAVLDERQYHVGRRRKDTVDWIVQQGDEAALFVECKTKRLTWASKAGLSDLDALEQDIRKLAGAVVQIYKTIADYRAGRYPHLTFVEARRVYPAVVTLEDWYFFGFDMPARLEASVTGLLEASGLPVAWLDEMPYSIISIHEFEKASGVVDAIGVHPIMSGKLFDPEYRRWGFLAYCNARHRDVVSNLAPLFRDEYDAMFSDVA